MEKSYTLTCKFKDTQARSRQIIIDNPTQDLSEDKILDFMNYVIDSNLLVLSETQPDLKYASISGATLTTKVTEDIELV